MPPLVESDPHCPSARWGVEEPGWKHVLPSLPDDMIALLAPPVVVTAERTRRIGRAGAAATVST